MSQRGKLRLLTLTVVLTGVLCTNQNKFLEFTGYYIQGHVLIRLQSASLIQCASVCLMNQPDCRAFNIIYKRRPSREYICEVLSSYSHLRVLLHSTLYYDPNMYQELGYKLDLGRLVHYIPPASTGISWGDAKAACKSLWGELLVPRTQLEWEWMKIIYNNMNYQAMWMPILETPGDLAMTWTNDGVGSAKCWTGDAYSKDCDTVDCGLYSDQSTITASFDVVIKDCYKGSLYTGIGYICEAAIPEPATYTLNQIFTP
ncbi:putative Lectin C-type domain-containing protein 1 [Homarus americanus]|uniref:Putative Lectin C-type domain-containing protein 1 n=1 Tax=Homarus americanus TaxID=6706 RepID=A0A8J5TE83_HOMAM|nr:putative Lectin C-type domain-containing protein 1 [Homarus americanus]